MPIAIDPTLIYRLRLFTSFCRALFCSIQYVSRSLNCFSSISCVFNTLLDMCCASVNKVCAFCNSIFDRFNSVSDSVSASCIWLNSVSVRYILSSENEEYGCNASSHRSNPKKSSFKVSSNSYHIITLLY